MSANVIAIDGPAASGKSSVAKKIAERLGIRFVSTGEMYRAVGWFALQHGIHSESPAFASQVEALLPVIRLGYHSSASGDGSELSVNDICPGEALRSGEVSWMASSVATLPKIRQFLVAFQRRLAEKEMIVMEGRDIGTAVFPDARFKFFLTASPLERARRRLVQEGGTMDDAALNAIAKQIEERDHQDMTRAADPLRKAEDAILIDNSSWTLEDTVTTILSYVNTSK